MTPGNLGVGVRRLRPARYRVCPPSRESTKISLAQRLRAHIKSTWPQLSTVHVRYRGQFAYVSGELTDGERLPLMRLRYGGSAHRWGTAIYVASTDSYENQIWLTGTIEDTFDLVWPPRDQRLITKLRDGRIPTRHAREQVEGAPASATHGVSLQVSVRHLTTQ